MKELLVSVIVPIYNVEKYLHQCVNSIIKQTYTNIEIILVDDGSPDNCPAICDDYKRLDSRIKVIHKANGGLSDARNVGTEMAQGEYVTYVDSDDWIDRNYVKTLLELAIRYNAEMSICAAKRTKSRNEMESVRKSNETFWTKKKALKKMLYQDGLDTGAWGRLTKIDIAKKHKFPKGMLFEDLATTYKYIFECEIVAYTNKRLYYYYQNQQSITRTRASQKRLDIVPIVNVLVNDVIQEYPELRSAALSRKFSVYCYATKQLRELNQLDSVYSDDIWNFIRSYRVKLLFDKNARLKNRCAAALSFGGRKMFALL